MAEVSQHHLASESTGETRMYCSMPKRSIKVFAAALACASKIGKEIVLNANDDGPRNSSGISTAQSLVIRTFNDTTTNYLMFTFHGPFFEKLRFSTDSSTEEICGKLSLSSCLTVFRSVRTMERLQISFVQQGARHVVVFTATCKYGIVKQHMFHYEDAQLEQPIIPVCCHNFCARTSLVQEALGHLHGSEEVTMNVHEHGISIGTSVVHSTHRQDDRISNRTEISISGEDLERFDVNLHNSDDAEEQSTSRSLNELGPHVSLTFAQNGMKALLNFCEAPGVNLDNVMLMFSDSGQPIVASTNSDDHLRDPDHNFTGTAGTAVDSSEGVLHHGLFEGKLTIATILTMDEDCSQHSNYDQFSVGANPQETRNLNASSQDTARKFKHVADDERKSDNSYATKKITLSRSKDSINEECNKTETVGEPVIKRKNPELGGAPGAVQKSRMEKLNGAKQVSKRKSRKLSFASSSSDESEDLLQNSSESTDLLRGSDDHESSQRSFVPPVPNSRTRKLG